MVSPLRGLASSVPSRGVLSQSSHPTLAADVISNLAIGTFWPYVVLLIGVFFAVSYNVTSAFRSIQPAAPGQAAASKGKMFKEAVMKGFVSMLPAGIFLTFLVYTSVCAHVFNAFRCEPFERDSATGEEWSYMVKHPDVRCSPATSEYDQARLERMCGDRSLRHVLL